MAEILVFEDHPIFQRMLRNILKREGHSVFEIVASLEDAAPAIARAVAAGVLVAIVDGTLANGSEDDGETIVNLLRDTPIKSIAFSSSADMNDAMGADIIVGKDGSDEELLAAIAQLLAQ